MTETLECPMGGCHATVEGETGDEVMSQAEDHAASSRPEVELDDETVETLKSNITGV